MTAFCHCFLAQAISSLNGSCMQCRHRAEHNKPHRWLRASMKWSTVLVLLGEQVNLYG